MERVRYLVIGAGISGLAFADAVGADDDVLVLEADAEIGGYCKTITKDGFVWDYSGHFFHFKHEGIEKDLVSRMGTQRILKIAKDSRIWWGRDRWIDFPFQKNIHQLPQAEFLECLSDLHFRTGWGRERKDAPASFEEMLYARFGRGIAERFLVPYNEKLYATKLSTLDVDAMGRFFPTRTSTTSSATSRRRTTPRTTRRSRTPRVARSSTCTRWRAACAASASRPARRSRRSTCAPRSRRRRSARSRSSTSSRRRPSRSCSRSRGSRSRPGRTRGTRCSSSTWASTARARRASTGRTSRSASSRSTAWASTTTSSAAIARRARRSRADTIVSRPRGGRLLPTG